MRYAQVKSGQRLHLVYEPGEGIDPQQLIAAGYLSHPLCGRSAPNGYRMTINMPLGSACKNCQKVYRARRSN